MRRLILASSLVLASCAPRPQEPSASEPLPARPQPAVQNGGALTGLNPTQLVQRLGTPALQIREGTSAKLQFRSSTCVLDAYLYPSPAGQLRVTYVDTRSPLGNDVSQAICISSFDPAAS